MVLPTQERRSVSGIFAGKYGLITLRDLFRWAERYRKSSISGRTFHDWDQQLAEDGKDVVEFAKSIMGRADFCVCVFHKYRPSDFPFQKLINSVPVYTLNFEQQYYCRAGSEVDNHVA